MSISIIGGRSLQTKPFLKSIGILVGILIIVPAIGLFLEVAPPGRDATLSYFLSRALWWGSVCAFFYYVISTKTNSENEV